VLQRDVDARRCNPSRCCGDAARVEAAKMQPELPREVDARRCSPSRSCEDAARVAARSRCAKMHAGGTKAAAAVAPPMPSPDASVLALRFFAIGWTPGDPPAAGVPSYSAVRRDPCRPPPRRPARAPFVPARPPGAPPRQRPMPQRRTLFLGVRQRNGEVSSLKLRSQIAPLETQRANLEGQFRRGTLSI
jgi:hypothetical protein